MSAALKPEVARRLYQEKQKLQILPGGVDPSPELGRRPLDARSRRRARRLAQAPPPVSQLSKTQGFPIWLTLLIGVKQSTTFMTMGLTIVLLFFYGLTVYSRASWSQSYRDLEVLRRNEREITNANEVIKNQMAQQAEAAHLMAPQPNQLLFLKPEPVPSNPPKAPESKETAILPKSMGAVGY